MDCPKPFAGDRVGFELDSDGVGLTLLQIVELQFLGLLLGLDCKINKIWL